MKKIHKINWAYFAFITLVEEENNKIIIYWPSDGECKINFLYESSPWRVAEIFKIKRYMIVEIFFNQVVITWYFLREKPRIGLAEKI